jgi:hypothetical protein
MTKKSLLFAALVLALALAGFTVYAQMARPYHDGTVWNIAFIRVKAGMDTAYMNYLASDWKKEQEALKAEGLILSYKVISVEAHTPGEWNLMLMTEYKSLAAMEAGQDKAEAVGQRLGGNDQKQMQGYKERSEIRDVLGARLGREIVLEPKK